MNLHATTSINNDAVCFKNKCTIMVHHFLGPSTCVLEELKRISDDSRTALEFFHHNSGQKIPWEIWTGEPKATTMVRVSPQWPESPTWWPNQPKSPQWSPTIDDFWVGLDRPGQPMVQQIKGLSKGRALVITATKKLQWRQVDGTTLT